MEKQAWQNWVGMYPEVQREALLELALQAVRLHQVIAVGRLAALDSACMHHPIPVKPATKVV